MDGNRRETIKVGSWRAKSVDAETYYREKLKKVQFEWVQLKNRQLKENAGITFVSFRDKSSVVEIIEEIDILKAKLEGNEKYDKLDIEDWEVEESIPSNDIIWSEINKGRKLPYLIKLTLTTLIPILFCSGVMYFLFFIDMEMPFLIEMPYEVVIALKYLVPTSVFLISLFVMPRILFSISLKAERHERKSHKEESYM